MVWQQPGENKFTNNLLLIHENFQLTPRKCCQNLEGEVEVK